MQRSVRQILFQARHLPAGIVSISRAYNAGWGSKEDQKTVWGTVFPTAGRTCLAKGMSFGRHPFGTVSWHPFGVTGMEKCTLSSFGPWTPCKGNQPFRETQATDMARAFTARTSGAFQTLQAERRRFMGPEPRCLVPDFDGLDLQ